MNSGQHRLAYIWFVGALIVSGALTIFLASIDRRMYDTNAEFLDYTKYRANRAAATAIGSEQIDPRSRGGLSDTAAKLTEQANGEGKGE